MSAQVIIKKYTGRDSEFGTVVSNLGIKRVDTAVPSTYSSDHLGGKVIPANDASEAKMYAIYRPDREDCWNYSMECVFKVHLAKAPDVQLSNLCIYPLGNPPDDPYAPKLMIGNSMSYSKPTNAKSTKAVHDIWDYSKEHPFYLTVSGLYGQVVNPEYGVTEFSVEYKDCGYGNMVYLNGERQPAIPVAIRTDAKDVTLIFKDRTFMSTTESTQRLLLDFVNPEDGKSIDPKYYRVIRSTDPHGDGGAMELKVKTADWNMADDFPSGLIYKIQADREYDYVGSGYVIYWVNLFAQNAGWDPVCDSTLETDVSFVPNRWFKSIYDTTDATIEEVPEKRPYDKPMLFRDVEVRLDEMGRPVYYINGVRTPQLLFDFNKLYHFINRSGAKFPMRFIGNMHSPIANNIDDVITDGIVVLHGNTNLEEIFVNPEQVVKAGRCIGAYQCTCQPGLGNVVYSRPVDMCGNYNMCRVGGGIYNPLLAGESDYVYLQLQVSGKSKPGYAIPDLEIAYDET